MKKLILIFLFATSILNAQVERLLIGNKSLPEPTTYGYLIDSDGDTLLDADGKYILVPLSYIEFEQFNKSKENENNIINKHLFAVLPKYKSTERYIKYYG